MNFMIPPKDLCPHRGMKLALPEHGHEEHLRPLGRKMVEVQVGVGCTPNCI